MLIQTALSRVAGVAFGVLSARNADPASPSPTAVQYSKSSAAVPMPMQMPTMPDRAANFLSTLPPLRPNRKRVYLLRHGQTDWNARGLMQGGGFDIPLNESGEDQARRAAEALGGIPLDVVASSHLTRARQTADAVHAVQFQNCRARSLSSAVAPPSRVVLSDFGEMRFGDLEGSAKDGPEATPASRARVAECNEAMAEDGHWSWPGPEGESAYQVEARARRGLEELLGRSEDERHVAVVAHSRTNKVLLASLLRGDATEYRPIEQGNTCINVVDWDETDGTVHEVLVNYVDHATVGDQCR